MENTKKKILILGAGRGQIGLYKACSRLGYESIAVSIDGDYPGFQYADRVCITDIKDREGVARLGAEIGADGIVTACMDAGLPALGYACEQLSLKGPDSRSSVVSSNKWLMKDAFMKYGVNTAKYVKINSSEELKEAEGKLGLPVIIKPVDLGGSRGINIVFSEEELERKFEDTMSATKQDYCIVEEYIDGYEFSATSFVAGGEVLFVLPTGDLRYGENDEIPVGHYVPFECDDEMTQQVDEHVRKAIAAIGLDDCAVNVDIMAKDGKPYILELTGRLGANAIPEITSEYYGSDIYELIVRTSVGDYSMADQFREPEDGRIVYGRMLLSEKTGTATWDSLAASERNVDMFIENGSQVNRFRNPGDCLGQIVVTGSSLDGCAAETDRIIKDIQLDVKRR